MFMPVQEPKHLVKTVTRRAQANGFWCHPVQYHLWLAARRELIARAGGLLKFMNGTSLFSGWQIGFSGPILANHPV